MCFSAGASFTAALTLGSIGALSLYKVAKTRDNSYYFLAAIPLLFGIQQASEGIIWVLWPNYTTLLYYISTYIFLTFALLIWPIWIPLSMRAIEPDRSRKKLLLGIMCLGAAHALYLLWCIVAYGAFAKVVHHHIVYDLIISNYWAHATLYVIATIVPFFVSSKKNFWLAGVAMAASCLISYLFWKLYFTSIWCFFAAILSGLFYLLIPKNKL